MKNEPITLQTLHPLREYRDEIITKEELKKRLRSQTYGGVYYNPVIDNKEVEEPIYHTTAHYEWRTTKKTPSLRAKLFVRHELRPAAECDTGR